MKNILLFVSNSVLRLVNFMNYNCIIKYLYPLTVYTNGMACTTILIRHLSTRKCGAHFNLYITWPLVADVMRINNLKCFCDIKIQKSNPASVFLNILADFNRICTVSCDFF